MINSQSPSDAATWSMYSFLDMPEDAFDHVIATALHRRNNADSSLTNALKKELPSGSSFWFAALYEITVRNQHSSALRI